MKIRTTTCMMCSTFTVIQHSTWNPSPPHPVKFLLKAPWFRKNPGQPAEGLSSSPLEFGQTLEIIRPYTLYCKEIKLNVIKEKTKKKWYFLTHLTNYFFLINKTDMTSIIKIDFLCLLHFFFFKNWLYLFTYSIYPAGNCVIISFRCELENENVSSLEDVKMERESRTICLPCGWFDLL